ncbi:MAG TPA: DUF3313 family protein [Casimicrobiaceae bacterium]|nr:DUF3313 family protein [Casimicrobiaceae bacterium]
MRFKALLALSALTIVAMVLPIRSPAADQAPPDGLMPVRSFYLDELYVRPDSDLAGYRKVVIDPVQIAFRSDWNQSEQDYKGKTRRLLPHDVQAISDDMTATLQSSVEEGFKARGFEIVAAAGPGALRVTARAKDLYVNAPDETPPGQTRYLSKDAGEVTLILEARDSSSGKLLARVVDHRISHQSAGVQTRDLRRTTNVASNFWFDETFRRWATDCAKAFEAANAT